MKQMEKCIPKCETCVSSNGSIMMLCGHRFCEGCVSSDKHSKDGFQSCPLCYHLETLDPMGSAKDIAECFIRDFVGDFELRHL